LRAVDGVSFSVRKGEILGLLGPNGAGKTTTIHLLLGLVIPDSGDIRIFGMDLEGSRKEILQRVNFSSAYVQLPPNLTVWENLNVFAKLYGIRKPGKRIGKLLDFFDIAGTAGAKTGTLSTGQLTRLNLAKALVNEPEVLFLDEPTASLDPDIAYKVRERLRKIRQEMGTTMIYTSHNMFEIEAMCSRILFLSHGKILLEGTPAEIKTRAVADTLEDVFITIARNGGLTEAGRTGE